jgi:hypothetical protein
MNRRSPEFLTQSETIARAKFLPIHLDGWKQSSPPFQLVTQFGRDESPSRHHRCRGIGGCHCLHRLRQPSAPMKPPCHESRQPAYPGIKRETEAPSCVRRCRQPSGLVEDRDFQTKWRSTETLAERRIFRLRQECRVNDRTPTNSKSASGRVAFPTKQGTYRPKSLII